MRDSHVPVGEWLEGPERDAFADDVWSMYETSYAKIGMHLRGPVDLYEYDPWLLFGTVAFVLFKRTEFGLKLGVIGSDGSAAGKAAVVSWLASSFDQPGVYGEVSHAVERLTSHAPRVCAKDAGRMLRKPIEPSTDGIHYRREIPIVGTVEKVMVGRPLRVPASVRPTCEETRTGARLERAEAVSFLDMNEMRASGKRPTIEFPSKEGTYEFYINDGPYGMTLEVDVPHEWDRQHGSRTRATVIMTPAYLQSYNDWQRDDSNPELLDAVRHVLGTRNVTGWAGPWHIFQNEAMREVELRRSGSGRVSESKIQGRDAGVLATLTRDVEALGTRYAWGRVLSAADRLRAGDLTGADAWLDEAEVEAPGPVATQISRLRDRLARLIERQK